MLNMGPQRLASALGPEIVSTKPNPKILLGLNQRFQGHESLSQCWDKIKQILISLITLLGFISVLFVFCLER